MRNIKQHIVIMTILASLALTSAGYASLSGDTEKAQGPDTNMSPDTKITYESFLAKFPIATDRKAAVNGLQDQELLAKIAIKDKDCGISWDAFRMITDQNLLAKVAMESPWIRYQDEAKLVINRITDQKLLAQLAIACKNPEVCIAAANNIMDQDLLIKITEDGKNADSRIVAARWLTDEKLLAKIAVKDKDRLVSVEAVKGIADEKLLAKLALYAQDYEVRRLAVGTLKDKGILAKIAVEDESPNVRAAAIKNLTDESILNKIAVTDDDGSCRFGAVNKLTDQKILSKIAASDKDTFIRHAAHYKLAALGNAIGYNEGPPWSGGSNCATLLWLQRVLNDVTRLKNIDDAEVDVVVENMNTPYSTGYNTGQGIIRVGPRILGENSLDGHGERVYMTVSWTDKSTGVRQNINRTSEAQFPDSLKVTKGTQDKYWTAIIPNYDVFVELLLKTQCSENELTFLAQKGFDQLVQNIAAEVLNASRAYLDNKDSGDALRGASKDGFAFAVGQLLDKGADVNAGDTKNQDTPLILACRENRSDIVKLLLDRGADVNIKLKGLFNDTALRAASIRGCADIVKLLLERGADVNVKNDFGMTVLAEAAEYGHVEVVKLLLERGAGVNVKDKDGRTALIMATINGHAEVVKLLLDKGADIADISIKDKFGFPALLIAVDKGHVEVVKLLLGKGADVIAKGADGHVALERALVNSRCGTSDYYNYVKIAKLLYAAGAK